MDYIIFDLEFNQAFNENKKVNTTEATKCPFEIIQIGALKLDSELNFVSGFNKLVKPKIFKKIHPYVAEITNISTIELNSAKTFDKVYEEFTNFIEDNNSIFCVWGMVDMKELFRNIYFHKLNSKLIPDQYINIQKYTSKFLKSPKGKNIGLRNAVELLKIPLEKDFHDAYNDAYYTAQIFKKLQSISYQCETYDPSEIKKNNRFRTRKNKMKIDIYSLLKQFEKMYQRRLTSEEKDIIILSYKMGLTNQFQIESTKKHMNIP